MPITQIVERHFFSTAELLEPSVAASVRDRELPPTAASQPRTAVVDLRGKRFTPAALHEFVVPLCERLRGGVYGSMRVVLAVSDQATGELIELLARRYDAPLYLTDSPDPDGLARAVPVGHLSATERQTLDILPRLSWSAAASEIAETVGIGATAATNRLVNLEQKGYVVRVVTSGRRGDVFVDPRAPQGHVLVANAEPPVPLRAALERRGITSDPYDTSRVDVPSDVAQQLVDRRSRR